MSDGSSNGLTRRRSPWRKALGFAIVHFLVMTILPFDMALFTAPEPIDKPFYWFVKLSYFMSLYLGYILLLETLRRVRLGDIAVRTRVFVFGTYLMFIIPLILIVWPGTWSWDDLWMIEVVARYDTYAWQHWLSTWVLNLFAQHIPCVGGIILVQNLVIGLLVADVVVVLDQCAMGWNSSLCELYAAAHEIKHWWPRMAKLLPHVLWRITPFLLPPVLCFQLSGFRMGLYSYLIVSWGVHIIAFVRGRPCGLMRMVMFTVVTILVATWRSEGILLVPVCLLILLMRCKCSVRRRLACVVFIILGCVMVMAYQKSQERNNDYFLLSLMGPLVEAVRVADWPEDATDLAILDKTIDVKYVCGRKESGTELFWTGKLMRSNREKGGDKAFLAAGLRIMMRHPRVVLKERLRVFLQSSNILGDQKRLITNVDTVNMMDVDKGLTSHRWYLQKLRTILKRPLSVDLRKAVLRFLYFFKGSTVKCSPEDYHWGVSIVWNVATPFFVLSVFQVWLCLTGKYLMALGLLCFNAKIGATILFEPCAFFMYWIDSYLVGWMIAIYFLSGLLRRRKGGGRGSW